MPEVLETEFTRYTEAKDELLAEHEGQYVLIHDREILGTYESQMDAINQGYELLGNVPFLVKKIERIERPINFVSYHLAI